MIHDAMETFGFRSACYDVTASAVRDVKAKFKTMFSAMMPCSMCSWTMPCPQILDCLHQKVWPVDDFWVLGCTTTCSSASNSLVTLAEWIITCEHDDACMYVYIHIQTQIPIRIDTHRLAHTSTAGIYSVFTSTNAFAQISLCACMCVPQVRRLRVLGLCWYRIPCSSWVFMTLAWCCMQICFKPSLIQIYPRELH